KDLKLKIRGLLRENRIRQDEARAWTKAWLAWLRSDARLLEGDRFIIDDHLAELAVLTVRIVAVETRLKQVVADDALVARLMSQPSVGLVTAVTMRAEI